MLYKKEKLLVEIARGNSLANLKKGTDNYSPTGPNEPLGAVAIKVTEGSGQSSTTYKRAKYVIENGTEQQKQLLRSGKSEINTIYKQIQNENKRQELIKNAKENPILELPESCELLYGDFREKLKDIPDNSIDLIFTDPPYKKQDLSICKDLAVFAARVLKPGGSLIVYTGGYEIPKVIDYLRNAGLKYWFYVFVKHIGGLSKLCDKGVIVNGKFLLWFVKGERPEYHEPIRNFIESTPPDKSLHDWSQSITEAEYIISHLTVENQVVLDPFLGGATTLLVIEPR
jgi:16S rRNA G966 N2-methylase RsmD